jgi:threonylcarbamoyladenosine tRNA methylthiotransferase MtaB
LLDVLKRLESIANLDRIRLSSLEPLEVEADLIHWIAQSGTICRHFHIPLQSGDDEILKKMNRNYDSRKYIAIINQVKNSIPDCGLGADIIVGFPGETEAQFRNTVQLVEQLPFTYLHVFSFSPRPGTEASRLPGRVDPTEIKRRSEILRKIGRMKKKLFFQSLIGQKINVLWEEKTRGEWMFGLTGHYARVRAQSNSDLMNKICQAEIIGAEPDFVQGKVVPDCLKCIE